MGLLDNEYSNLEGSDSSSVRLAPCVLDVTVSRVEVQKTKDGSSEYISVDFAYKDNQGEWRYIKFNNFNPEKSDKGAQMWKNLLVVAGAKNGNDLQKKQLKVVVAPESYEKQDGSQGASYKVFELGYFSKDGKSPSGDESKMLEHLSKAVAYDEAKPRGGMNAPVTTAAASPETESDMPF